MRAERKKARFDLWRAHLPYPEAKRHESVREAFVQWDASSDGMRPAGSGWENVSTWTLVLPRFQDKAGRWVREAEYKTSRDLQGLRETFRRIPPFGAEERPIGDCRGR